MYYYSGIPNPPWTAYPTTLTFKLVQSVDNYTKIGSFRVGLDKIGSNYVSSGKSNDWTFNVEFIY